MCGVVVGWVKVFKHIIIIMKKKKNYQLIAVQKLIRKKINSFPLSFDQAP